MLSPILFALLLCLCGMEGGHAQTADTPPQAGYDGKATSPLAPVTVNITSPMPDEVIQSNLVDLFVSVDNYVLAPEGNRLHVILNNQPPIVMDNTQRPITFRNLPEGGHCLRVLAVRPDGVSLRDKEAFAMVRFYVRKKDFKNFVNPQSPFLTLNLPANEALDLPEDGRVWLDFRLQNASLQANSGYAVRYRINNAEDFVRDERPIFWQGLKPGRYEIEVELMKSDKQPVAGMFNLVKRFFEIRAAQRAMPVIPAEPSTNSLEAIPE